MAAQILRCVDGPKAGVAVRVPHGEETWDFPLGDRQTARYRVIGTSLVLQEITGLPTTGSTATLVAWYETGGRMEAVLPDGSIVTTLTLPGLFCHVAQRLRRMGVDSMLLVCANVPEQREGPRRSEALPSYD